MTTRLTLSILPEAFAICRLAPTERIPDWAMRATFYSITRTDDEISIVCSQANVPDGTRCDVGWRSLKIDGPLDFSLTGILAAIAGPLAEAGISIFTVSTYDTDYVLVKQNDLENAVLELSRAGHLVHSDVDKSGGV